MAITLSFQKKIKSTLTYHIYMFNDSDVKGEESYYIFRAESLFPSRITITGEFY